MNDFATWEVVTKVVTSDVYCEAEPALSSSFWMRATDIRPNSLGD